MRKYIVSLVALGAPGLCGTTTLAQSSTRTITARATATTTKLTTTAREVMLSNTCGTSKLPCELVFLGVQKNAQGDRQLVYARDIITGSPSPGVFVYHATNVAYDALGSLTSKYTGTTTIRRGTQIDQGQGGYIGGTGAYRGVTGKLSFTGRNRVGAAVSVFKLRATLRFPREPQGGLG